MQLSKVWYQSIIQDIRYWVSRPIGYIGIFLIVVADTIEGKYTM